MQFLASAFKEHSLKFNVLLDKSCKIQNHYLDVQTKTHKPAMMNICWTPSRGMLRQFQENQVSSL